MKLRPFFGYYGGKYRAAPYYPPPVHDTIIEPFAGSAGYSMRYPQRRVILVERDEKVAATWRYLIRVSASEILALPDLPPGANVNDLALLQEARWLIGWWLNKAGSGPGTTLSAWGRSGLKPNCFWGAYAREIIARQVAEIRHWTLIEGDYTQAPDVAAAWFVDPPYANMGKHYRYANIDYAALAEWCRARKGQVTVCENAGADWLPFQAFRTIKANPGKTGGKTSEEVIWTNAETSLFTECAKTTEGANMTGQTIKIIAGDNIASLRTMADNSVGAVIVDPPYGLSDHDLESVRACLALWLAGKPYSRSTVRKGAKNCLANIGRIAVGDADYSNSLQSANRINGRVAFSGVFNFVGISVDFNDGKQRRDKQIDGPEVLSAADNVLLDNNVSGVAENVCDRVFDLRPLDTVSACVSTCSCFTLLGDSRVRMLVRISANDLQLLSGVVASGGAEKNGVLTLDLTRRTAELTPANGTAESSARFRVVSIAENVGTRTGARSLPAVTDTNGVSGIRLSADGANEVDSSCRVSTRLPCAHVGARADPTLAGVKRLSAYYTLFLHSALLERLTNPSITRGGFCGKDWDEWVPGPELWREVIRVLKPGGYLLAFASTRSDDLMAIAIRLAGFRKHPFLAWLNGQGFPKATNLSKQIDRRQRFDRAEVLEVTAWIASARDAARLTNAEIDAAFGFVGMAGHWTSGKSQPTVPTLEQVPRLLRVLDTDPPLRIRELLLDLNGRKGQPGEAWFRREVIGERRETSLKYAPGEGAKGESVILPVTASATQEAEDWEGWFYGLQSLKPGVEPILMFQKPEIGRMVDNVRKYGTGAINVDGCRVAGMLEGDPDRFADTDGGDFNAFTTPPVVRTAGRWPPNVVFTHSAGCRKVGTREVSCGMIGGSCPDWPDTCRGHDNGGRSTAGETFHGDPPEGWTPGAKTAEIEVWECAEGCPVKALDLQSGMLKSGAHSKDHVRHVARLGASGIYGETDEGDTCFLRDKPADEGGASRFFPCFSWDDAFRYCPKASRKDREEGLNAENMLCSCEARGQKWENAEHAASIPAGTDTRQNQDITGSTTKAGYASDTTSCGNLSTDRSPQECQSTTITETSRTTGSRTLSSLTPLNTSERTANSTKSATVNGGGDAAFAENGSAQRQNTGTRVKRDGSCTDAAAPVMSAASSQRSVSVCPVCGKLRGLSEGDTLNRNPCVKPVGLMRWLCRLVTPPGGVILDPFCGSGSTGKAAIPEGFSFIGLENDPCSVTVAEARLSDAAGFPVKATRAGLDSAPPGLTLPPDEYSTAAAKMAPFTENEDMDDGKQAIQRPYITEIEFTGKGCAASGGKLAGLGRLVLFVGTNGAGKTAWLDAMQAAESDAVDACAGKARSGGDLFAFAPEGQDVLSARCVHSDGSEAVWETARKTHTKKSGEVETTISKPTRRGPYDPAKVFPLRDLQTAVAQGVVGQRQFFLRAAGGLLDAAAVENAVRIEIGHGEREADLAAETRRQEALIGTFRDLWKQGRKGEQAPDALIRCTKASEAEARAAGERRDAAARRIGEDAAGLGARPEKAEIDAAEAVLADLEARLRAAHSGIAGQGFDPYVIPADIKAKVDEGRVRVSEIDTMLAEIVIPDVEPDPGADLRLHRHEARETLADVHTEKNAATCFVCAVDHPAGRDGLADRGVAIRRAAEAERGKQAAHREALRRKVESENVRKGLQEERERITAYEARARAAWPHFKDRHAVTGEIATAKTSAESLRSRAALHAALSSARAVLPVEEAAAKSWSSLAAACRAATAVLLAALAPAFEARVNRFLPANWRFGLILWDDGREVCRWGLRTDSGSDVHVYTSGGEWAAILAAVAAACVPDDYRGLAVLVFPDAELHPAVRREVLAALSAFPGQVFATACLPPEPPAAPEGLKGAKLEDWRLNWRVPEWTYATARAGLSGWDSRFANPGEAAWTVLPPAAAAPPPEKRKAGRPRKPKPATDAPAVGGDAQVDLDADDTDGADAGQAPEPSAALLALGYEPHQIAKMTPNTRAEILEVSAVADDVSVYADGSWTRIRRAQQPVGSSGRLFDLME